MRVEIGGHMAENKFNAGDLAQIIATGEVVTIIVASPGMRGTFYTVFQDGKRNRYREAELAPYFDRESGIVHSLRSGELANADSFQRYTYYRLFSESQEGNLFSYQGNKIIFNPFQYKPLMKFLAADSDERLLVADEVGVGKTIESGIILDELFARQELQGSDVVMIVCPSILCQKWQAELRSKFLMDDFWVHDGKTLSYALEELGGSGRVAYPHSIVSEQLVRGARYRRLLRECLESAGGPFIQMLIVDECHHYRNLGTNTNSVGNLLSLCSERLLMLSATPFNLRSDDLYNQLHMLNPSLFQDQQVFNQLQRQIRSINQAIAYVKRDDPESRRMLVGLLADLTPIAMGNELIADGYSELRQRILSGEILSAKDKVEFERMVSMLNPIASSFTRTLKRDAIEHRVTRETVTLEVHYSALERDVYDSFLEANLRRYRMLGVSERAFGLILNGLERIAASSIVALQANVKRFIRMPDEAFAEMISEDGDVSINDARAMKQALQESYDELLRKIQLIGDDDSKYETFQQLIERVQESSGDNRRVIVFSFYTETLKYLRRRLTKDGYSVALMYGKTPYETPAKQFDEDGFRVTGRNDIMRDFEAGEFEILLISEVGGEGIDLQFCTSLINYDLPYNPMRIEQRIGRIDRMGQTADKIVIGNLCIDGTVDVVINRVLLSRIADATDLVGELEPIIAQGIADINSLIVTRDFTEEELAKRESEIEQQIEKARLTREEFEEARYELVNDKGFRQEFEESVRRSRISPRESLLFTQSFLRKVSGCWCKPTSESGGTIHVTKDMCERLKAYAKRMNLGKAGEEIRMLADNNGDLAIDFDGDAAYANENCAFFKPSGAWIHFVIDYIRALEADGPDNVFYVRAKASSINFLRRGTYWLFVYDMEFKGFYETRSYEYVVVPADVSFARCLSDDEKKLLLQAVQNAKIPESLSIDSYDDAQFEAESAAEERKEAIIKDVASRNNVKIGSRIRAVSDLSAARIRSMEDELIGATGKEEDRIRRAIAREQSRTAEKISILEEKMNQVGTYALDAVCLLDAI